MGTIKVSTTKSSPPFEKTSTVLHGGRLRGIFYHYREALQGEIIKFALKSILFITIYTSSFVLVKLLFIMSVRVEKNPLSFFEYKCFLILS